MMMKKNKGKKMIHLRSLILHYFNKDIYIELLKITMISNIDNNEKGTLIKSLLNKYNIPFSSLGSGTNRMAVMIDGYAVKFALDRDGMIDNRREILYSKQLQPYVVKVYESTPNGLIAVCEYVSIFTLDEYQEHQEEMKEILTKISSMFLIGDVGIAKKNYVNWGTRNDGSICILDFAYIYSVKFNVFTCADDGELLKYDNYFNNLVCPHCGRKYTFGEIRRRITRKDQENEIGDIRRIGYNLVKDNEEKELVPEFEPVDLADEKKSKDRDPVKRKIKEFEKAYNDGLIDRYGNPIPDDERRKNIEEEFEKYDF